MAQYSTHQVARAVGVNKSTLLRWLYAGKLAEPTIVETPTSVIRIWSDADLKRAQRYKEQNYRKGRGRKNRA
jgi:predicted site-specific integrase-resolvase